MNRWLRFILIQRHGLAEGSTEEDAKKLFDGLTPEQQKEARSQAEIAERAVANGGKDLEAETRAKEEGRKLEVERQSQIRSMCQVPGCEDLAEALCNDASITPELASRKIIERMKETKKPVGTKISHVGEGSDNFRAAVIDGFLAREGVRLEKPAQGFEGFRHIDPSRVAEECLRMQGVDTLRMSKPDIIRQAMKKRGSEVIAHGTAHFPYILENIAFKMALQGFAEEEEIWPLLCAIRSVNDFREFSVTGISGAEDLDKIEELAPYTEGKFKETREKAKMAKYGKKFSVSFEAMLADELAELTTVPRRHGQAAKRLLNKLAIAILTDNAAMNDGNELFSAAHSNIVTAAALSAPALAAMKSDMRKQTGHGEDSEPLNIPLSRVLTGSDLEYTAAILCTSPSLPESGISNAVPNPNKGIIPISTSLITSATAYYGFADPNKYDVMIMAFLGGKQAPDFEEIDQKDVDGFVWKIRMCAVSKAIDWLGMNYNAGA